MDLTNGQAKPDRKTKKSGMATRDLDRFFRFSLWWRKRICLRQNPQFWGAVIAGDEPKRGANDLWGYES